MCDGFCNRGSSTIDTSHWQLGFLTWQQSMVSARKRRVVGEVGVPSCCTTTMIRSWKCAHRVPMASCVFGKGSATHCIHYCCQVWQFIFIWTLHPMRLTRPMTLVTRVMVRMCVRCPLPALLTPPLRVQHSTGLFARPTVSSNTYCLEHLYWPATSYADTSRCTG